jgi:CheY-specific phosphatase CheX
MSRPCDVTLASVAERMFEGLAFMISMPQADGDPPSIPSPVSVRVAFDGPLSGTLVLTAAEDMLPALARNMLGLDGTSQPSLEDQMDALKELVNVICGNLLPALTGTEAVFDVHSPELLGPDAAPCPGGGPPLAARASLTLDEGQAELALYVPEGPEDPKRNPNVETLNPK